MRTITYMKGGQVLTREVPDLTQTELDAIAARQAQIQLRNQQRDARDKQEALRTESATYFIKGQALPAELKAYYDDLQAVIDSTGPIETPERPSVIGTPPDFQKLSEKGQANGYASLDSGGKVPSAQLPAAQQGGLAFDDVYPVGSVYMSRVNQPPSQGTWLAIEGRFIATYKSGDADFGTVGATGGAKTSNSSGTVSQPTFTGSALGAHSHGAGTLAPSAHAGAAVAAHADHTHTYTQVPNHVHTLATGTTATGNFAQVIGTVDTSSGGTGATPTQTALGTLSGNPVGGVATGTTAGPGASLTHSVTQPSDHTMSGSSQAVSAGTPAGTVSQPTFTGSAQSILPPFVVYYAWERTA